MVKLITNRIQNSAILVSETPLFSIILAFKQIKSQ